MHWPAHHGGSLAQPPACCQLSLYPLHVSKVCHECSVALWLDWRRNGHMYIVRNRFSNFCTLQTCSLMVIIIHICLIYLLRIFHQNPFRTVFLIILLTNTHIYRYILIGYGFLLVNQTALYQAIILICQLLLADRPKWAFCLVRSLLKNFIADTTMS